MSAVVIIQDSLTSVHGIRRGKLSYCAGVRLSKLFVYKLTTSLIKITTVNTKKPVLYCMLVKKGTRKIQKARLYAFLIRASG